MSEELWSPVGVMRVDREDFVGLVMISLGVEFMVLLTMINLFRQITTYLEKLGPDQQNFNMMSSTGM